MANRERHVGVARLANVLPVVHGLEHGEQAVVLLQVPRQRIQVPGTRVRRQRTPRRQRRLRRGLGGVYVLRRGLQANGECLAGGRRDRGRVAPTFGVDETVVHEKPKAVVVSRQPLSGNVR